MSYGNTIQQACLPVNTHLMGYEGGLNLFIASRPEGESVKCLEWTLVFLQVLDKEMEVNTFTYEQIRIQPE